MMALRVKRLTENATLPSRVDGAAGYDLSSAYDYSVPPKGKVLVKTDLSIEIPEGTYARIAPRSGLAVKNFIDVGAGVVDGNYRGNVGIVPFNFDQISWFEVKKGDRVAQLILERIETPDVVEVDTVGVSSRGSSGFGSTGV
mgnify:CR=1 FL=1